MLYNNNHGLKICVAEKKALVIVIVHEKEEQRNCCCYIKLWTVVHRIVQIIKNFNWNEIQINKDLRYKEESVSNCDCLWKIRTKKLLLLHEVVNSGAQNCANNKEF